MKVELKQYKGKRYALYVDGVIRAIGPYMKVMPVMIRYEERSVHGKLAVQE